MKLQIKHLEEEISRLKQGFQREIQLREEDLNYVCKQLENSNRQAQLSAKKLRKHELETEEGRNILSKSDQQKIQQQFYNDLRGLLYQKTKVLSASKKMPSPEKSEYSQLLDQNYRMKQRDRFLALQKELVA